MSVWLGKGNDLGNLKDKGRISEWYILPLFSLVYYISEAIHQCIKKQRERKSVHAVLFADSIVDKLVFRVYNTHNFIYCSSAAGFALEPAENSESGQNPERYRHCMRGGAARDESQSLGFFLRRQCEANDTRVRRPA